MFIATDDDFETNSCKPRVSINWNTHTIPATPGYKTILATTAVVSSNLSSDIRLISVAEKPFYIDSGAMVCISPCVSDFVMLKAILPQAVKEVGGTSIQAIGIGQIRLQVQNQTKIYLKNALYIPNSTV